MQNIFLAINKLIKFYIFAIMQTLKKHIALLCLFVLTAPNIIQFAHTLEEHKHIVCNSENETHLHELEIDCSGFHFYSNVLSYQVSQNFTFLLQENRIHQYSKKPQIFAFTFEKQKPSRAPPVITL